MHISAAARPREPKRKWMAGGDRGSDESSSRVDSHVYRRQMVQIQGLRGPSGEFGALGVVELPGCSANDVFHFVGECTAGRLLDLAPAPG